MKSLIFLCVFGLSLVVSADPLNCYEAASRDRVIKWSDDLKVELCRKASSTVPYECFAHAYTNNSDFKISSTMAVLLCQGATDARAPLECFEEAIQRFPGMRYILAAKFCAATTSAEKAMSCFVEAQKKFALTPELAADLCAQ